MSIAKNKTTTLALDNTTQLRQNEDQLCEIMSRVYELLDEARRLIPFFHGIVEHNGQKYWAELYVNKNAIKYPNSNQHYHQKRNGIPWTDGFWYELFYLDYNGHRPRIYKDTPQNRDKYPHLIGTPVQALNRLYKPHELTLIQKIC